MVGMLAKGLTIGPLSAPSVSEGDVKCVRVWVHVGGWVCVWARVCAHVCACGCERERICKCKGCNLFRPTVPRISK